MVNVSKLGEIWKEFSVAGVRKGHAPDMAYKMEIAWTGERVQTI